MVAVKSTEVATSEVEIASSTLEPGAAAELPRYRFAVVLPPNPNPNPNPNPQQLDSAGASAAGGGAAAARGGGLSRSYALNEGLGTPAAHRRHFELYKITGERVSAEIQSESTPPAGGSGAAAGLGADDSGGASGSGAAAESGVGGDGLTELVQQLRETEALAPPDYKLTLRRLYLQWHPDKSPCHDAQRGFMILREHESAYKGDRAFDAIYAAADDGDDNGGGGDGGGSGGGGEPPDSLVPAAVPPRHAAPATWFDEFERERQHVPAAAAAARQAQQRARVPVLADMAPRRFQAAAAVVRRLDIDWADRLWRQAASQEKSAAALAAAGQCADSVWHAQQAAELSLKSLMLRTCGITDEELK